MALFRRLSMISSKDTGTKDETPRPSTEQWRASVVPERPAASSAHTQSTIGWAQVAAEAQPTAASVARQPIDWDHYTLIVSYLDGKITMHTKPKAPLSSGGASPTLQPVGLVGNNGDLFTPTTALSAVPRPKSQSVPSRTQGASKRSSESAKTTGSRSKARDHSTQDLETLLEGREAWRTKAHDAFLQNLTQMIQCLKKESFVSKYAQMHLSNAASSLATHALKGSMLAQQMSDQALQSSGEPSKALALKWTQDLSLTWVRESAYRVELAATARLPDGTTFCGFEERLGAFTPNYLDLIGMEEPDPQEELQKQSTAKQ